MMKTKKIFTAVFCLCTIACNKNEEAPRQGAGITETDVRFNVARQEMSKAGTDDNKVVSIAVAVFNSDGYLDASGYSASDGITLNLHNGSGKKIFVACNAGSDIFSKVASVNDIGSLTYSGIKDNSELSSLGMSGAVPDTTIDSGTKTITVDVTRRVCKISLGKVTNSLPGGIGSMTVTDIYLSNICADYPWFGSGKSSRWMNQMGASPCSASHLSALSLGLAVANGQNTNVGKNFYCCPNSVTQDSSSSTWSERHTRLVIKASILGNVYYYPIDLQEFSSSGTLEANTHYHINNVSIKRLGSNSAEEDVTSTAVDLDVKVLPWKDEYFEDIVQ